MFRGQFTYNIDAKGRLAIPAKLRKHVSAEANDTFIMTISPAECIEIYPADIWAAKIEAKMLKLNSFLPDDALFLRMINQNASDDVLDSQSRILIPKNLLQHAKIEKEVLILGVVDRIEAWNPKVYEEYIAKSQQSYSEIAVKVMA